MLYKLGRFLQVLGLLIMPLGMVGNINDPERVTVKGSLIIAAVGIGVFGLGWVLQQGGRRPG